MNNSEIRTTQLEVPQPINLHISTNWREFHALKIAWVRYYADHLIAVAAEDGLEFKPDLYIYGYVIADIIGDIENAFAKLPYFYREVDDETTAVHDLQIAREYLQAYTDRVYLDITTILRRHAQLPELPIHIRRNIALAAHWIEQQNFHDYTEFFVAYHTWLALKKWVQRQLDEEEAQYFALDPEFDEENEVATAEHEEKYSIGDAYLHASVMGDRFLNELWQEFVAQSQVTDANI